MTKAAAFRGQPLLVLCTLLICWMALRAWALQPPSEMAGIPVRRTPQARPALRAIPEPPLDGDWRWFASARPENSLLPIHAIRLAAVEEGSLRPLESLPNPKGPGLAASPHRERRARGDLSWTGTPSPGLAYRGRAIPSAPMHPPVQLSSNALPARWSADAWLLLRQDAADPLLSSRPSYGRSQAGGVVRYRFAAASKLRPQAYLRASAALAGAKEQEIAAGVSGRPVPGVPLRLAAEARFGETASGITVRPAVYVVTELPPLRLPLGISAEAYAQAGYVGGDFATAFADGQARLERPVFRRGAAELSAGAGVWGGAQKDASRVDLGPTAAFSFRVGAVRGRVAADYRFRVAGAAAPSSGPALTLSAGF